MTDDNPAGTEHRLVAERRRKLEALREAGFRFPNQLRRTALAGQILSTYEAAGNAAATRNAIRMPPNTQVRRS